MNKWGRGREAGGKELRVEGTEENERGGRLGGRLKGVRKRKRARHKFECEVVTFKLRLVKVKEEGDR